MEKQKVSLFRRKNHWGLTVLGVVVCAALSPALGMMLFLPQALSVVPILLMVMLGFAGPVSAAVCSAIFVVMGALLFGVWGGVAVALLIIPVVIVSALMLEREQPFWQSAAAGGVTMFASMFAVVAMLTMLMGSDVVTALSSFLTQAINSSGALGDTMLSMMMQTGLLQAPSGAESGATGLAAIDPATRGELINSIILMMDSTLRLEIPMRMATAAVSAGLLGQAVLRKGALREGTKVEYPALRTWHVPRGWGRILGGTLVLLYVLAQLVPSSMTTMYYVFTGVFDQIFSLQGVAAVCYMLHQRGKSSKWQAVVFVLGYYVLGSMAVVLGIADQAMDFARRREELDKQDNLFDPRREQQ